MADFLEMHGGVAPPLQIGAQAQGNNTHVLPMDPVVEEELIDCQETETPMVYEAHSMKPPSSAAGKVQPRTPSR